MARRQVVPFKCEECGAAFPATEGELCRSCARLLCRQHLIIPLPKRTRLRDAPPPLCKSCGQAEAGKKS